MPAAVREHAALRRQQSLLLITFAVAAFAAVRGPRRGSTVGAAALA